MIDIPILYKNILMIILTILLFFILSIDSNWNDFLNKKKSIKFIIIFVIIYLNYYNINLSLICLPLFIFILMKHPNFKSRIINNPKLSYFKDYLQSFYSEFFNDYSSSNNNINNSNLNHNSKNDNTFNIIDSDNSNINNLKSINSLSSDNNILNKELVLKENILKDKKPILEEKMINIIDDEGEENKSTSLININIMDDNTMYDIKENNMNENKINGNKELTMEEMKELYESIKFELNEIDKKYEN